jgi:ribosome-binding protein aMBF1 (putative translation factor)
MKKKSYTFRQDLKERLTKPKFKKAWDESQAEYSLAKQLIEARLSQKLSQRDLAKKLHTSQAVISRLETMRANPSLSFLKRIAHTLDTKLVLPIE